MESATYDTISEDELIKKYNSFIVPCEESKSILFFLWKKHLLLSQINAGCTIVSCRNTQIYNALA